MKEKLSLVKLSENELKDVKGAVAAGCCWNGYHCCPETKGTNCTPGFSCGAAE